MATEALLHRLKRHNICMYDHAMRVGDISFDLAKRVIPGAKTHILEEIRAGGQGHDLGKIATPNSILNKTSSLTKAEWKIMHKHPHDGVKLLLEADSLRVPSSIIFQMISAHHETYSKKARFGYPNGLHGNDIPLVARICAVADVWDTITHKRPYRDALHPKRAETQMRRASKWMLDPAIVDHFLEGRKRGQFLVKGE